MPCIQTKTNVSISPDQEILLKERFGKAIELIPGKSESWLMLTFDAETPMYFKGCNDQPMAFVIVSIYGQADASVYDRMTGAITKILGEILSIPANQIYVKYEEVQHWGWSGNNF